MANALVYNGKKTKEEKTNYLNGSSTSHYGSGIFDTTQPVIDEAGIRAYEWVLASADQREVVFYAIQPEPRHQDPVIRLIVEGKNLFRTVALGTIFSGSQITNFLDMAQKKKTVAPNVERSQGYNYFFVISIS